MCILSPLALIYLSYVLSFGKDLRAEELLLKGAIFWSCSRPSETNVQVLLPLLYRIFNSSFFSFVTVVLIRFLSRLNTSFSKSSSVVEWLTVAKMSTINALRSWDFDDRKPVCLLPNALNTRILTFSCVNFCLLLSPIVVLCSGYLFHTHFVPRMRDEQTYAHTKFEKKMHAVHPERSLTPFLET